MIGAGIMKVLSYKIPRDEACLVKLSVLGTVGKLMQRNIACGGFVRWW